MGEHKSDDYKLLTIKHSFKNGNYVKHVDFLIIKKYR